MEGISMYGCRENNLKNINVTIPYGKIVSFIGVSGSGKSTLAFDTLYAEGKRRYMESLGVNESYFLSKIKKPNADHFEGLPPAIALMQNRTNRNPRSTVGTISQMGYYLQVLFSTCSTLPEELKKLTPSMFNLNSPDGICPFCEGLGETLEFDETLIWPNQRLSIAEGGLKLGGAKVGTTKFKFLNSFIQQYGCDVNTPIKDFSNELKVALLFGQKKNRQFKTEFPGIIMENEKLYHTTKSLDVKEDLEKYMVRTPCEECMSTGYRKEILKCLIDNRNINDFTHMELEELLSFLETYHFNDKRDEILETIKPKFIRSLKLCLELGIGYLTMARSANTLSGGEAQRLKIVAQISSEISGIVYILDEPSSGLHASDVDNVLKAIKRLNSIGNKNTVVLVEHTKKLINASDYIFEIGPQAGIHGGNIIASGSLEDIINNENSLSGPYLSNEKNAGILNYNEHFTAIDSIRLNNATINNLKNVTLDIPLKSMVAVTGVSGSGKTSLIFDALYQSLSLNRNIGISSIDGREKIKNIILCDQTSIGKSSRSTPLTYLDIYMPIRKLFAGTEEAKKQKFDETYFSFNIPKGRCESCSGEGSIKVNMGFLPEMNVICSECEGKRFKREILDIKYNGYSIYDILNLSIDEACEVFKDEKAIVNKLNALIRVGLSYIKLGQPTSTLSGGESQRLKLANEIAKTKNEGTLLIFDEPTKGLHFEDVKKLLIVMKELVKAGNSLLIVEHNLDVIASSDYVIDIGPKAGKYGGNIMGTGTPLEIAKLDTKTGNALREYFETIKKAS